MRTTMLLRMLPLLLLVVAGCDSGKKGPDWKEFQRLLTMQGGWSNITWDTKYGAWTARAKHDVSGHTYYFTIQRGSNGIVTESIKDVDEVVPDLWYRSALHKKYGLTDHASKRDHSHERELTRLADQFWDAFCQGTP